MQWIFIILGFIIGAFGGCVSGSLLGWLVIRLMAGPYALSNPDLPGGMAWLEIFIFSAVGFFIGGVYGVPLGKKLYLEGQSMGQNSDGEDC
ncbi:hypothetical protein [Rubinisphaera italica]|uniref:Uncharacterized protein n=1 Tax=Rubinisphaera italica TaxID=2527969 RepID=A0A5C5XD10_9PLAN|nr:hypothetical protein [Rubinisphaera italica]TWT60654.1 hypothetical protein Pan54_13680 [Rubinisphaera italica]